MLNVIGTEKKVDILALDEIEFVKIADACKPQGKYREMKDDRWDLSARLRILIMRHCYYGDSEGKP